MYKVKDMQWNVTKSCWSSSLKFYYFWHNLGFVNKSSYQNIFSIWLKCMREPLHLNFITQKCPTTYTEGYRKKGPGCCLVFYKHSCPPPSPPKKNPLKWLSDGRIELCCISPMSKKTNQHEFLSWLLFSHLGRIIKLKPGNITNTLSSYSPCYHTNKKNFFSWWRS